MMKEEKIMELEKGGFHFLLSYFLDVNLEKEIFKLEVKNEIKQIDQCVNFDEYNPAYIHHLIEYIVYSRSFLKHFKAIEDHSLDTKYFHKKLSTKWSDIHKKIEKIKEKEKEKEKVLDNDLRRLKLFKKDLYNEVSYEVILELADPLDLAKVSRFTNDKLTAIDILKWRCRGLSIDLAIRKVAIDKKDLSKANVKYKAKIEHQENKVRKKIKEQDERKEAKRKKNKIVR